ncbi:hypothetical protein [Agromyces subbeticus]|uniref:hypothetical protein n=1 Tax=Agromyces subbeticus TaxID=293890 RepID=UPI0003B6259F|nr:hypothetical protein [Agromyces subbeticus]
MSEPSITDWISAITGIVGVGVTGVIGYFTYRATRQVSAARTDIAEINAEDIPGKIRDTILPKIFFGDADDAESTGNDRWAVRITRNKILDLDTGESRPGKKADFALFNAGGPAFNVTVSGVSASDQAALHLPPMPIASVDRHGLIPIDLRRRVDTPPVIVVEITWMNEDTTFGVARRLLSAAER